MRQPAAEKFNREVRRKETPTDIPTVPLPDGVLGASGIRVDKLIARTGLAESVTDAKRKREAGADRDQRAANNRTD